MTDPNTPARGGENTDQTARFASGDDAVETPVEGDESPRDETSGAESSGAEASGAETGEGGAHAPEYPAVAPADEADPHEPAAEGAGDAASESVSEREAAPEQPAPEQPAPEQPAPQAFEAPDAATRAFDTTEAPTASQPASQSTAASDAPAPAWSASRDEPEATPTRTVPPLSPPSASPATTSTGALPDDSALRAAEAARSGGVQDPAVAPSADTTGAPSAADTGDVGDTRIVTANGARSSTAWTAPPAPTSPTEYGSPATASTPTPYAPAGSASPAAPPTSTTPLSNLGASPAASLGFTDGIAGGDDGFTPEELSKRRAFRDEMAFRQKQEFAGINFGSAFFGWLAAVGLAGLLYLVAAGIAEASGLAKRSVLTGGSDTVKSLGAAFSTQSLQITALVVFLVVLFLSYFVGGFVASRMARFSGLKQGLAVWLWGLVMSIIAAVVVVVIVSQSSGSSSLTSSMKASSFTSVEALVSYGLIVVLSVGGALLGGLAGQGFHRRVDRFGFDEV